MKRKRFTEEQIIGALKQHQSGQKVADICRELGVAVKELTGTGGVEKAQLHN